MSLASSISPASPITHATPALAQAAQPTEESSNNKTEARRSSDGRSNGSGWSEWFDTGDDGQPEMVKDNRRYSKSNTSAVGRNPVRDLLDDGQHKTAKTVNIERPAQSRIYYLNG
ncbi:hypothetical protein TrVGV298_007066 [Trichoderma virens]|nr:hypothetical protein TrVGV298_007066 [Trichoderma virens]